MSQFFFKYYRHNFRSIWKCQTPTSSAIWKANLTLISKEKLARLIFLYHGKQYKDNGNSLLLNQTGHYMSDTGASNKSVIKMTLWRWWGLPCCKHCSFNHPSQRMQGNDTLRPREVVPICWKFHLSRQNRSEEISICASLMFQETICYIFLLCGWRRWPHILRLYK